MNKSAGQSLTQIKMIELQTYKMSLEKTLLRLLMNDQNYIAHLEELLDVCNEIKEFKKGS